MAGALSAWAVLWFERGTLPLGAVYWGQLSIIGCLVRISLFEGKLQVPSYAFLQGPVIHR